MSISHDTVFTHKVLEDAIFGYIIGEISRKYYLTYYSLLEREPTSQELSEFNDFLLQFSNRLMTRIKEFVAK
jgi:hypothetical protein